MLVSGVVGGWVPAPVAEVVDVGNDAVYAVMVHPSFHLYPVALPDGAELKNGWGTVVTVGSGIGYLLDPMTGDAA